MHLGFAHRRSQRLHCRTPPSHRYPFCVLRKGLSHPFSHKTTPLRQSPRRAFFVSYGRVLPFFFCPATRQEVSQQWPRG